MCAGRGAQEAVRLHVFDKNMVKEHVNKESKSWKSTVQRDHKPGAT